MDDLNENIGKSFENSREENIPSVAPDKFARGNVLYRRESRGMLLMVQSTEIVLKLNTPQRHAW